MARLISQTPIQGLIKVRRRRSGGVGDPHVAGSDEGCGLGCGRPAHLPPRSSGTRGGGVGDVKASVVLPDVAITCDSEVPTPARYKDRLPSMDPTSSHATPTQNHTPPTWLRPRCIGLEWTGVPGNLGYIL